MMTSFDSDLDQEYCPNLSEAGRNMLRFLREHPAAPIYRNQSGHRLLPSEVETLRVFESEIQAATVGWVPGALPDWLDDFISTTYETVPYFRQLGSRPKHFIDIPTTRRADLARDIASFVPDTVPIDRLINFRTTGTTGNPLLIASHPLVAGRYLAFHKRALRRFGVEPSYGAGDVGVVILGMQKKCFTYVSVTPTMHDSGLVKINLHPDDWRDLEHRMLYLEALRPEIIAGDPISFGALLHLPAMLKPKALLSVGMMLSLALRQRLEQRFCCPVLDLYSMNEAGPIAVFDEVVKGHLLLQNRLYLEILDPEGQPVGEGERGEIVLTGGFNFCLPLLRYCTGDFASLVFRKDGPVLKDLCGRKPVRFCIQDGSWINNIDVTHALTSLPLSQYGLHQNADGSLLLWLASNDLSLSALVSQRIHTLFGHQRLKIEVADEDKIIQYTSDLPDAL